MSAQQKEENEEKTGEKQNEGPGKQLVEEQDVTSGLADAQTCYLGVVVGDRDHTDLNSWSLVALSQEVS